MTATAAVYHNTLRQLIGRRRSIGLLVLSAIPGAIQLIAGRNPLNSATALTDYRQNTLFTVIGVVTPIIAIVLAASAMGDERRGDTLPFLMLRPVRPEATMSAKLLSTWSAAVLIAGAGGLFAGVAVGITASDWGEVVPTVLATAVTALAYVAVYLVVGYVTDRAVIIGLAILLIWENGIARALDSVSSLGLWRIGMAAYAGLVGFETRVAADLEDHLGKVDPGFLGAVVRVVVLSVLAVMVMRYLVRRRDLI